MEKREGGGGKDVYNIVVSNQIHFIVIIFFQ